MEDVSLIELVQQHPCIYDAKNPHYKDINVRDNVLNEIAISLGKPNGYYISVIFSRYLFT